MRSFMENGVQDGTLEKPNIKMWAEEEDAAKQAEKQSEIYREVVVTRAEGSFKVEGLLGG